MARQSKLTNSKDILEMIQKISDNYVDNGELNNALQNKADKEYVDGFIDSGQINISCIDGSSANILAAHYPNDGFNQIYYSTKAYISSSGSIGTEANMNAKAFYEDDTALIDKYATKDELNTKADKTEIPNIEGLASESYVQQEIAKVNGSGASYDDTELKNQLANKAEKSELFSGDYNDLINRPAIPPTNLFATKSQVKEEFEEIIDRLGGLRFKKMTKEQYDALIVRDANTFYVISTEATGDGNDSSVNYTEPSNLVWTTGMNLSDAGAEVTNSSQASYRTTNFVKVSPHMEYRVKASTSAQFTVFYYDRNQECIGHSPTVNDKSANSSGAQGYVLHGFINKLFSRVEEDVYYIRIRTNSADAEITVTELGAKDESNVPYIIRNGWSIVSSTGATTGGSGASGYMMLDYIEIDPYYEYSFVFKGSASTKMYLYDSDKTWISTLPSSSGNYTSSTNTVLSSSFPEGTRYVRMRTANATVGMDNSLEHLTFTRTPIKSENIMTLTWIDNSDISSSTGSSVADSNDAIRSDYLAVSSDNEYMYSALSLSTGTRVFYYDTNKQFLSCSSSENDVVANQKLQMPEGTSFIRVRADKSSILTTDTIDDLVVIKKMAAEEGLLYTFGLLSDVHIDGGSDGSVNDFGMSKKDYKNALRFLEDEGAEFISYSGDMTNANSGYADYEQLIELQSQSNIPSYLVAGNHDVGSLFDSMINPNKYFTVEQGNDIHVYVNVKDKGITGGVDQQTINAVKNIIENNTNKRIFVYYHYFIRYDGPEDGVGGYCGDCGGNYYTAETCGDNYEKYPLSKQWADLILGSTNVIFCHGHSHARFNTQDRFPNNNYYHAEGRCHSIHVPSCAVPRKANSDSAGMSYYEAGSEGYIVKVFTDRVEFRAIDLATNTYLTEYNQVVNLPQGN